MSGVDSVRYLPLASSGLDQMEAAYLSPNGVPIYHTAVGFGASSRVQGAPMHRSFNAGLSWGTFSGEGTRFVNTYDNGVACAAEENHITNESLSSVGSTSNQMRAITPQSFKAEPSGCMSRSYATYAGCVNCNLNTATQFQCNQANNKAIMQCTRAQY